MGLFFFYITEDFADVVQKTELHSKIPFSLDGTFIKRYFGEVKLEITYLSISLIYRFLISF